MRRSARSVISGVLRQPRRQTAYQGIQSRHSRRSALEVVRTPKQCICAAAVGRQVQRTSVFVKGLDMLRVRNASSSSSAEAEAKSLGVSATVVVPTQTDVEVDFSSFSPTDSRSSNASSSGKSEIASATESSAPRRKRRAKKAPITVTQAAAERVKSLIEQRTETHGDRPLGIRLGVKKRGCNGLSYTMTYATEAEVESTDEQTEQHGLNVFVDQRAIFFILGTTMDFVEDDLGSEFKFTNPMSKGSCGCGESFNV